MNIKTKLILGIGMLAGMIILLVTLSVVNLQLICCLPQTLTALPLCRHWNALCCGFPLPAVFVY